MLALVKSRTTLVLVTHDTAFAARSGRVVRLNSGRIVEEDPAEALGEELALAAGRA